jgi:hypothetical protein
MRNFSNLSFLKRFLVGGFFLASLFVNVIATTHTARADVWGAAFGATLLDQVMTTIKTQLKAALLGTLKVAAIEVVNSKVGQMIGGTAIGNTRFVTDWNQFLYEKPKEEVDLYMNDFFTRMTRGKDAGVNYVGLGDTLDDVGGNYLAYLVAKGKTATASTDGGSAELFYDLDEYAYNPRQMIADGNWMGFNAFIVNPANNPMGVELIATQVYQKKLAELQEAVKTEAMSSGYIAPKDKNGKTIAPAAVLEGMQNDALNIGNTVMAAATEPGEFLAGVVGALVNKTITNIVQNGVGKVQASIKKEIKAYDAKISKKVDEVNKKLGPAAKYLKEASQRVDTNIKPYTKPPPPAKGGGADPDCGAAC